MNVYQVVAKVESYNERRKCSRAMKKHRLLLAAIVSLVLVASVSILLAAPAQASIKSHNWVGTTYRGFDSFYNANVIAYETGSKAALVVSVYNESRLSVSIEGAKIEFDWPGGKFAAKDFPSMIKKGAVRAITFEFTVPSTIVASNLVMHSYTITVDYEREEGYEGEWNYSGFNFVIYSFEQAEAMRLKRQLTAIGAPEIGAAKARKLLIRSATEERLGDHQYTAGNIAEAKTYYQTALELRQEAISAESDPVTIGISPISQLLKGIGILLFGLGLLVYAIARLIPKIRGKAEDVTPK